MEVRDTSDDDARFPQCSSLQYSDPPSRSLAVAAARRYLQYRWHGRAQHSRYRGRGSGHRWFGVYVPYGPRRRSGRCGLLSLVVASRKGITHFVRHYMCY